MPLINKMHMLLLLIYSICRVCITSLFTSAVPIAVYFLVLHKAGKSQSSKLILFFFFFYFLFHRQIWCQIFVCKCSKKNLTEETAPHRLLPMMFLSCMLMYYRKCLFCFSFFFFFLQTFLRNRFQQQTQVEWGSCTHINYCLLNVVPCFSTNVLYISH